MASSPLRPAHARGELVDLYPRPPPPEADAPVADPHRHERREGEPVQQPRPPHPLSPPASTSVGELGPQHSERLHPVARSLRRAGSDIYTSKKELIPKGSLCVAHFMMLFRTPDIFKESESFIPGRWQNPTRDMMDAVNPFSLGKQNCVCQSLARAETSGIIARIISQFELSIETEGEVVFFLTLKPEGARLRARRL